MCFHCAASPHLVPVTGQPEISRDNLQPMIAVTGRIEGRGIGAAVGDVQKVLAQAGHAGAGHTL